MENEKPVPQISEKEFSDLFEIVEKKYGITKKELTSKFRLRQFVELRGICANILYKKTSQ